MSKYKVEITVDADDAGGAVTAAQSLIELVEDVGPARALSEISVTTSNGSSIKVSKLPLASGGYIPGGSGFGGAITAKDTVYRMWNGKGPLPTKPGSYMKPDGTTFNVT